MTAHGSTIVREVIYSTGSGADVMSALPGLVRQLLDEDAWREFAIPGGTVVRHETFGSFVRSDPPKGLGGRENQLVALCGTDGELASRVRSLLLREIPAAAAHGEIGRGRDRESATHSRGRDSVAITARLKRDDPELADRVIRGEITANAAAHQKGWRKPRILLTTPERTAESIRKYMPADARRRLAQLLAEEDGR